MLLALTLALAAAPPMNRDAYGDPLPPGAVARLGTARFRHPDACAGVAVSADGTRIASLASGGLRVFDASTGRVLRDVAPAVRPGRFSAVSADFRLAAFPVVETSDDDAEDEAAAFVRVIDVATGRAVRVVGQPEGGVAGVAFSPDARYLAVALGAERVRVVDLATGKLAAEDVVPKKPFPVGITFSEAARPTFSRDGKTLAFAGRDSTIRVWAWRSGKPSRGRDVDAAGTYGMSFGVGDKTLAYIDARRRLMVRDLATGKESRLEAPPRRAGDFAAPPTAVAYSPKGRYLAAAENDGRIRLWDAKALTTAAVLVTNGPDIRAMTFSADGSHLVTQDEYGVRQWHVASGRERCPAATPRKPTEIVAAAGGVVLTVHGRGPYRTEPVVWDGRTGKHLYSLRMKPEEWDYAVALSADGTTIATATRSYLRLTDAASGRTIAEYRGPAGLRAVSDLAFSTDGRFVRAVTEDGRLVTRTSAGGRVVADVALRFDGEPPPRNILGGMAVGTTARFSPGGSHLLFRLSETGFAFDAADGRQVGRVAFDDLNPPEATLSPDGRTVLEGGLVIEGERQRCLRRVRDAATGRVLRAVEQAYRTYGPVCISPDGSWYAAVCSRDQIKYRVAVCHARSEAVIMDIDLPCEVASVAASADGTRLIVGMTDSTALVYPIAAGAGR